MNNYQENTPNTQGKSEVESSSPKPHIFWTPTKFDDKSGELLKVKIEYTEYYHFLESHLGIRLLDVNGNRKIVRITDNVVEEFPIDLIANEVRGYLLELNTKHNIDAHTLSLVTEQYITQIKSLHDKARVTIWEIVDEQFLHDTSSRSFVCFLNCIVEISYEGINCIPYSELGEKLVWKSHIIPRSFHQLQKKDYTSSLFSKFCNNVAGETNNFDSLRSILGYLMHNYSDPANPRAVILHDKFMNGTPNGGTGKGLLIQGVQNIRWATVKVDGKQFKHDRFPLSQVNPDTQVVFLDDILPNFDFTFLFSGLTEGLSIEKKGKDIWRFIAEFSPKVVLATNTPLLGNGTSHARRKVEFGLTNYYNDQFTPMDEFGCRFFHDFDSQDWLQFDNFMLDCILFFLRNGLITSSSSQESKLMATIESKEFIQFASKNVKLNEPVRLSTIRAAFDLWHPKVLRELTAKDKRLKKKKGAPSDREMAYKFRDMLMDYGEAVGLKVFHDTKRTTITFHELATFETVEEFLEAHGENMYEPNEAYRSFIESTGTWCSDEDFIKYLKVISRP